MATSTVPAGVSPMSEWSWAAVGAAVGTFVTGFFAWLVQKAKGDSDRDVAVIAQWEKLTRALSDRVTALESELAEVRRMNEGLLRMIAQDSQSTARLLGSSPVTHPKDGSDGR
jgi:hypothetical protein